MNQEQESYISLIKQTSKETIRIKKTGWEEIKLPGHAHEKCQIIYTLSGTLHVQIGSTSYFVPEKHIAWIPGCTEHELSSKNRQVSLVIFYLSLDADEKDTALKEFSIYHTCNSRQYFQADHCRELEIYCFQGDGDRTG